MRAGSTDVQFKKCKVSHKLQKKNWNIHKNAGSTHSDNGKCKVLVKVKILGITLTHTNSFFLRYTLTLYPDSTHRDYEKYTRWWQEVRCLSLGSTHDDNGKYTYYRREVHSFNFGKCKVPAKNCKNVKKTFKKLMKYNNWF
jgi:hypothetical protein